jgi:hypothetical protein
MSSLDSNEIVSQSSSAVESVYIGENPIFLNRKGKPVKHPNKVIRTEAQLAALKRGREALAKKRLDPHANTNTIYVENEDGEQVPLSSSSLTPAEKHSKVLEARRAKIAAKEQARLDAIARAEMSVAQLEDEKVALQEAKALEMQRIAAIREMREAQRIEMMRRHEEDSKAMEHEKKVLKESRKKELINELTTRIHEQYIELQNKKALSKIERKQEKQKAQLAKHFSGCDAPNVGHYVQQRPVVLHPQMIPPSQRNQWSEEFLALGVRPSDGSKIISPFVLRGRECDL